MKSAFAAAAVLFLLAGCSVAASGGTSPGAPAAGTAGSSAAPSSATTSAKPSVKATLKVASKGASSKACKAANAVFQDLSELSAKAASMTLKKADVQAAFSGKNFDALPAEVKKYAKGVQKSAQVLATSKATALPSNMNNFIATLGTYKAATEQVCS